MLGLNEKGYFMSDNATGLNSQYTDRPFGLAGDFDSTGAPGSPSVPDESFGPVLASPVVSVPYASSQVPGSMPRVSVTSGDTTGMSSDSVVPPTGDPLTGLRVGQLASTNAGSGRVRGPGHPNRVGGATASPEV